MDDDVLRRVTLIEMSPNYSVYKVHTNKDDETDDEFRQKVIEFQDTLNVFLDEFGIKPHEMQMFCNAHFMIRSKRTEFEESKKYPKQCQKCLSTITYDGRFKPCSGISCINFN